MHKSLKICHVITRMIIGGAQENTLLTVRGLAEKGHDVTLLTGPTQGPEGRLLEQAGLPPSVQLVELPGLVRKLSPWRDLQAWTRLQRYFREQSFDVIHTHSSKAGILGRLAAGRARCPLILHTVHGQAFHSFEKPWRNWLYIQAERLAARPCDHIIAVAQAMIDQCVAARVAPRERYSVIFSGMEMGPFLNVRADEGLRRELGIPAGVPVVGKIARLFELKGHDQLLDAVPAVLNGFPETRFLLVGDGDRRAHLEARVQAMGIQDRVVFAGLVSPGEIPRYTGLMDMLVHLSLREGLPRTVVQALASGIPAVGVALDGTPEVIRPGKTGILCPPDDAASVAEAIIALLSDPAKRREMGAAGREFVRERFEWHCMVDQIEALYVKLSRAKNEQVI